MAYKIPVSQKAKLSPSIIFDYDKPIAIIGDFHKGREKLFLFLSELLKMNILDNEELKKQIHDAETYLYDARHENKFIILECGEIYDMRTENLEDSNRELYENEILKIDETINNFIAEMRNPPAKTNEETAQMTKFAHRHGLTVEQAIETEKLNKLGIAFWDEVLFYN